MNWLNYVMRAISAIPAVITFVETLHSHETGATKKQLALGYLGLSTGVASIVAPGDATQIQAIAGHVGDLIDSAVSIANAVGQFQHTPDVVPVGEPINAPPPAVSANAAAEPISGPGLHNVVPA